MSTPENELMEIQELITSSEQGLFPVDTVAFCVAECIIKYNDAKLLEKIPAHISSLIVGMINAYKEDGFLFSYSNVGKVDKAEFVRQLIGVLEA
ncbi:hypothetical protein [Chitinimonas lacunae]|uniref:Uncharacterized protein n=1 Tax=Chitinimonas lacunae TaxID=1963018 RepID=A0ABV8MYM5_9NEIS